MLIDQVPDLPGLRGRAAGPEQRFKDRVGVDRAIGPARHAIGESVLLLLQPLILLGVTGSLGELADFFSEGEADQRRGIFRSLRRACS